MIKNDKILKLSYRQWMSRLLILSTIFNPSLFQCVLYFLFVFIPVNGQIELMVFVQQHHSATHNFVISSELTVHEKGHFVQRPKLATIKEGSQMERKNFLPTIFLSRQVNVRHKKTCLTKVTLEQWKRSEFSVTFTLCWFSKDDNWQTTQKINNLFKKFDNVKASLNSRKLLTEWMNQ